MITLTIPGIPIAKKRPRFARRGKFVVTYNDQGTEEGRFLFEAQRQWRREPLKEPLIVECSFFMPIPKGTSKKKILAMLAGTEKHTKKPDASNLIKFIEDCLNGFVWKDDSQIFRIVGEKFFSESPRTLIQIKEVDHESSQRPGESLHPV